MPSDGPTRFRLILSLLSEAGAEFVVIGGLALQIYGGDHFTVDVDFAFVRRRENARRIADALGPFHPRPLDWPEGLPFVWDDQTLMNMSTITLVTEIGRIDFLAEPPGAPPFDELRARAVAFDLDGHTVRVACIEDLKSMKRAAGRPKDLAHIAELETIERLMAE